jgi:two-component system, chemotaxis family, protein-glutamate methylesterase/glutaminase
MISTRPGHDIVVVGASAGGVQALSEFVRALPANLPAAIFIVLHLPSGSRSRLPLILSRSCALTVKQAIHGEPILNGRVYVARPDRHLLIQPGHVVTAMGPRENGFRPAVDPLFRSAAVAYGARVIGVVLSGNLSDGVAGLASIKSHGGFILAQDPEEALYGSMPQRAVDELTLDFVASAGQLGQEVTRLVGEPARADPSRGTADEADEMQETESSEMNADIINTDKRPGVPAGFGCPSCGGALFRLTEGDVLHFRCRVGHAWSAEALLAEQGETLESALWAALRALEESAALAVTIGDRLKARGSSDSAGRFYAQAQENRRRAHIIRSTLRATRTEQEGPPGSDVRSRTEHWTPGNSTPYVEP